MSKFLPLAALLVLAGCAGQVGEFDETGGINARRSTCPTVAVPAATGDVTLFNPPTSQDARALDVTATITNVRSSCATQGSDVVALATFDVEARRVNSADAREVVLPYFATVVQGGNTVVAKRVSRVLIRFEAGQARASGRGEGQAVVSLAAASLPPEIVERLQKRRKATDADASIDPMSTPDVRAAVARASFELLVGFQLTPGQLQYNATR